MRFKITGMLFLLLAIYFAGEGLWLAQQLKRDDLLATVYPMVAIFLALTVRVLQAEKHHRERLYAADVSARGTQAMPPRDLSPHFPNVVEASPTENTPSWPEPKPPLPEQQ